MANVIKLKRGSGSDPQASDLVVGELCIRTDNGKLFTKKDSGAVSEISAGGNTFVINTLSQSNGTGGGSATFNGTAYRFTMSNPPSTTSAQCLVSINGVVQKPIANQNSQPAEGFTCYGNDIIFSSAPASGADFFIVTYISLAIGVPSDDTVNEAKLNVSNSGSNGQFLQKQSGNTGGLTWASVSSYTHPNHSGEVTSSGDGATTIASNVVDEDNLKISNSGSNGQFLQKQSGNTGGLTWATVDLSSKLSLTGGTLTGDLTISGTQPALSFVDTNHNDDFKVYNNNGILKVYDITNSADRVAIHSNGDITVVNNLDVGQGLDVTGNITVTGTVDGVDIAARNTLFGGLTSSSGVLTNGVTATTQSASDNSTKVATTAYTDTAIANLIDSSPSALNTLNELAAALGDDANFSTTVTNSIATKLPLAGGTLTGNLSVGDNNITNVGEISVDKIKPDGTHVLINMGTNKNISFSGGIGEIGNVTGFQTTNDAQSANTSFGIRANDIRFATGNAERVRIDSTGVGIGATSPQKPLNILASGTELIRLSQAVDASTQQEFGIGWASNNNHTHPSAKITTKEFDASDPRANLLFYTRGTNGDVAPDERMRIDSSGNVGIGATSVDNLLHVEQSGTGSVAKFQTGGREASILLQNDARTWKIVNYDYGNNGTDHLGFHDGNADRLVIQNDGKLSAGSLKITDDGSPGSLLEVFADDEAPWALHIRNDTYGTGSEGLKMYQTNSGIGYLQSRGTSARGRLIMQQHNGTTTNKCIEFTEAGEVDIYHSSGEKFSTRQGGVLVSGQANSSTFSAGQGMYSDERCGLEVQGQLTGLKIASTYNDSSHPEYGLVFIQGPSTSSYNCWSISPDGPAKGNSLNFHYGAQNSNIHSPGNRKIYMTGSGDWVPHTNNASDLGTSSKRWRNIYTTDLHLSNEGKTNKVDGTWGDWTLQEGEEDIFMINNRSGKKYKMALQEVS